MVFLLLQLDPPAYLYVSPNARRLIGIDSGSPTDADLRHAMQVHPDDLAEVERGFVEAAGAGLAAVSEHRMITEDGDVRWVNAVATPVLVPDGPTERTVITLEDVTDRVLSAEALRTAEAAARAANNSKSEFLSRMSPRAAHAAERGARLRAAARARRLDERPARSVESHDPQGRPAPARADQRRARHLAHRVGPAALSLETVRARRAGRRDA